MKAFNYLLDEYDESAWRRFAQCFEPHKSPADGIGDDMWSAMKYLVSPDDKVIFKWLEEEIPALSGHTPVEVLQTANGKQIMHALLMRMPC